MITITPIGFVHNTCSDSQTPELIKKKLPESKSSLLTRKDYVTSNNANTSTSFFLFTKKKEQN